MSAAALIAKKGQPVTLIYHEPGEYDLATNTVTSTDTTVETSGVVLPISRGLRYMAGTAIEVDAQQLLLPGDVDLPEPGTTVTMGGKSYTIIEASPIAPAGEALIYDCIIRGSPAQPLPPVPLPLDIIGDAMPVAAYGTRRLSLSYDGPALRVRRDSDDAELDIAFVGADLDTASLDAFIAGATGFIVTEYDQSGNGNDATQAVAASQPRIDRNARGARTIMFPSAATIAIPDSITIETQALTILAAMGPNSYTESSGLLQLGSNFWWFERSDFVTGEFRPTDIAQRNHLPICGLRQSPTATDLFMDEQMQTGAATTSATKVGGTIGNLPGIGGFPLVGIASAVVIYDRALTDEALAAGRSSMHTTFNVPETKTADVFGFGDSIFSGAVNVGFSPLNMAVDAIDGARLCNTSQGGSRTTDLPTYATTFSRFIAAGSIAVTNMGTNDIGRTTDDAATIYARVSAFCSSIRNLGASVIVATILPASNVDYTAPRLAVLDDLNALIRGSWADIADGLLDYAADPIMGALTAPADTSLYLDGLHPTEVGAGLLVPATKAAIEALIA